MDIGGYASLTHPTIIVNACAQLALALDHFGGELQIASLPTHLRS